MQTGYYHVINILSIEMCCNHEYNSFNCGLGSVFTCPYNIAYFLKTIGSKIKVVTEFDKSAISLKI